MTRRMIVVDDEEQMIGKCPEMVEAGEKVALTAATNKPVLLLGEKGTGKSMAAREIHRQSQWKDNPLVVIRCWIKPCIHQVEAMLRQPMAEAQILPPQGGAVLLDGYHRLPPDIRKNVLSALQEGNPGESPIGNWSGKTILSCEPEEMMQDHAAYAQTGADRIDLPTLRKRGSDLGLLARHFFSEACIRQSKELRGFNQKVRKAFGKYSWPGNVEELKRVCDRMVLNADPGEWVDVDRLPPEIYTGANRGRKIPGLAGQNGYVRRLFDAVADFEAQYISKVLEEFNGNQSHTARVLGIHRNTLLLKMKTLDIPSPRRRREPPPQAVS